jgi:ERCC4-type nuclease
MIIDYREKELIALLPSAVVEPLDIGDIVFRINDETAAIIERKTLHDLAASIRDGRYEEQAARLTATGVKVFYLIEGTEYTDRYTGVSMDTLYSAMFSLQYNRGFNMLRTYSIDETAHLLTIIESKIQRGQSTKSVIKSKRADSITPENIGIIMLCQIPSISSTLATHLLSKYSNIFKLKEHIDELAEFTYISNGKPRKLNKTNIANLHKYLHND